MGLKLPVPVTLIKEKSTDKKLNVNAFGPCYFLVEPCYFVCRAVLNFFSVNGALVSRGKQLVLLPDSPDVSRDFVSGNIRIRGKTKLTSFPRDHILGAWLHI